MTNLLKLEVALSSPQILIAIALRNLAVAIFIVSLFPEFFLRFVIWLLAKTIYRLRCQGREHIPVDGAAVIVANMSHWLKYHATRKLREAQPGFTLWFNKAV